MGLFNKLLGRNKENSESTATTAETASAIPADMSEIEKIISENVSHLNDYKKIPLTEIAALGGMFAQLSPALRTVAQTVSVNGMGYMPINNLAGEALKQFTKNSTGIYAGSFKDALTGKSTMAQFVKLPSQTITSKSVMPINPMMMAMAVMMAQVSQKLDIIQKTQANILSFLQEDKQAKLQGNLNLLDDILDKYKFNWENEQYRSNYHMKALDIKQSAEQDIIFYQKQIADKINNLSVIFLGQAVKDMMGKIADDFHDYSTALFLFSYSSYLEVMLLGNFSKDYLNSVAERVQNYQEHYQNQFSKCSEYIAKISGDSVEMKVQGAIGQTGKFLGNLIASSSLLSKGHIDEWLKEGGEHLLEDKDQRVAKIVSQFEERQDTGSELFIDSIRNVETVCNNTQGVLFDKENLYLIA